MEQAAWLHADCHSPVQDSFTCTSSLQTPHSAQGIGSGLIMIAPPASMLALWRIVTRVVGRFLCSVRLGGASASSAPELGCVKSLRESDRSETLTLDSHAHAR